jgi:L-fuconolactonase
MIDAHVHFWKYDRSRLDWIDNSMKILKQDYLPENLSSTLNRNGISSVIAVQAEEAEVETHWLVELSKTHPMIKGVVGWVDLLAENVTDRIDYFSRFSIIKGYRHIAQKESADFFMREDIRRGIGALVDRGYTYDILVFPQHLEAAADMVGKFPEGRFVLDHCGKPSVKKGREGGMDEWKQGIERLARHPNVYCKLSGLITEAEWKSWSPKDFYPFLDVVFENFGVERLMFGTDWPVMLLSGMYVQWKSLLEKYMEDLDEERKEWVFGGNAERFYLAG